METAVKLVQIYEANYPEYLHRVFVINGKFWKKVKILKT